MKPARFAKVITAAGLFLAAAFLFKSYAQIDLPYDINDNVPESCDENGLIKDTFCPCPPEASVASVCGLVSDANITQDLSESPEHRAVWSTRKPVGGVTVTLYENDPSIPTGKPFGNLEKKLIECETSQEEGKYHCLMRRLNPGNMVYVIFSCGGRVADIKIVPSVKSITDLDSDVDCSGSYAYTPLDTTLNYADRDKFLGCTSSGYDSTGDTSTADVPQPNVNAGFTEPENVYESANIGEKGGDIRFTPFSVLGGLISAHPGAYEERDCLFEYNGGEDDLHRTFNPLERDYRSVEEKCNFDPDRNGDGIMDGDNGNPLDDPDELTTPFRYDIPTLQEEHEQQRVWETRTSMQREMQDPRAFAQYNHLMFGECTGKVFLRYFGDQETDAPISCSELIRCNETLGDPQRNIHTTMSFGSRLEFSTTWEDILDTEERDPNDIVCHDPQLGDVKVSEIQPPFPDDPCTPGESGCRYKLSRDYYMPQFFVAAGGVKKPKTAETTNDAYGSVPRSLAWDPVSTEAEFPHESGHYVNYEDASSQKTNSGTTAIRISSKDQISDVGGVLANQFVSYIDALDETYDYTPSATYWDVGGDVKSLCTISSVQDLLAIPDTATESGVLVSNNFKGNESDHSSDETAATATYASDWAVARDEYLNSNRPGYLVRDVFDTLQRFASGGGVHLDLNTIWGVITTIASRGGTNDVKSFAERENDWTPAGYPSYMTTTYCIAEDNFNSVFPAYGEGGYPGDAGACYPWHNVASGHSCNVWPGPPDEWGSISSGTKIALGYDPNVWPGIEGELRTCRIKNCEVRVKTRSCDEDLCFWYYDNNGNLVQQCDCGDGNRDGTVDSSVSRSTHTCDESDIRWCLENQDDTWGISWDGHPPNPPRLRGPDYSDTHSEETICDLERAGPMEIPGDIEKKDHGARIVQQPFFDQSQLTTDPVSQSANYTALALTSKVENRKESNKASFVDYATTNDLDPLSPDQLTHERTAGAQSKGFGTGATVDLLKTVSHPERTGTLVEPFPEFHCSTTNSNQQYCWFCNIYDPNSWCYAKDPPPAIDLDNMDGGSCNPSTTPASCPLHGYVPAIAERILGAAGDKSGVNGALLLAVISGEGGWIGPGARLNWTDENVRAWSEPWYARIPGCNDLVTSAQGPFGLITTWFDQAVADGGYHSSRVSPTDGSVVVSKCNFIDAAYAAARLLEPVGCGGYSEADVRHALAIYRGGSQANPSDVPQSLVDIAMRCQ